MSSIARTFQVNLTRRAPSCVIIDAYNIRWWTVTLMKIMIAYFVMVSKRVLPAGILNQTFCCDSSQTLFGDIHLKNAYYSKQWVDCGLSAWAFFGHKFWEVLGSCLVFCRLIKILITHKIWKKLGSSKFILINKFLHGRVLWNF